MRKKQIVIEIAGGLGNQMFQYAFYLKMKHLGYESQLYFDTSQLRHNGFELSKVFNIDATLVSKSEVEKLLDKKLDLLSKLKRKISGHNPSFYWEHDKGYAFKPEILKQKNSVYLQGCWLSEKYFADIQKEISDVFRFPSLKGKNQEVAQQIFNDSTSVGIHIRRGDYLTSNIHRNLDYKNYLNQAISLIKVKYPELNFYVFSDDSHFAKEIFNKIEHNKVNIIDWNRSTDAFNDMHLMSLCRHQIICNSTFSWWAAWLNNNPDKIVISPKDWFTSDFLNDNDIVPDEWIKI